MAESPTHYAVLGVPVDARADFITQRYKALLAEARSRIASGPLDPEWLSKAREAFVVLSDPQKRAAYDALLAAPNVSKRPAVRSRNFFARAWRGEVRAWKPFWLLLTPSWLIVQGLITWIGLLLVVLLAVFIPIPALVALGVLLLTTLLAGALMTWRCAPNVSWRPLGYVGRVCAVAMVAALGLPIYQVATGKGELGRIIRTATALSVDPVSTGRERRLLVAARQGDVARVRKFLDEGESPSVRETERHNLGRTPLHYAAGGSHYNPKGQHLEVAKLLIARGADANAKGDTGYTPMHVASGLGQVEMVDFLLKNGADINAKDVRGTPLQAAVLQGHEPVVSLLIESMANLDGSLAVMGDAAAYKPAHAAIIARLLDAGANPNEERHRGYPAFEAIAPRSEDLAYLLVSRGADLLATSRRNEAPRAFLLAQQGYVKTLKLAFDQGFPPATRATDGRTLMHVAKSAEVVDLLISKGLRVDEPDRNGDQPLHHAAKNANGQLMAHLLAKGAKANAGNAAGRTPLMLLRGYRDKEASTDLLDLLIEQGADLRPRDKNGYGAVDVAAEQRDLKILKHLLKKGARAAAADPGGYTALHRAQSREVAEALIEAGASPKSSALDGKTPLHRAANGHGDVVDLLLGHAVDVNAVDKAGQTPIFSAAGHESIAKKLIEAGATVNVTDHEGKTPIHYAASRNIGVVKLLLEKGARVDVKDKLGNTPLHEAARLHNDYFAKSLIELGADPQARNGAGKTPADVAEDAARTRVQQSFSQSPAKK